MNFRMASILKLKNLNATLHSILTCAKSIIQENIYYISNFVAHHFDVVARMPPAITQLLDFPMI